MLITSYGRGVVAANQDHVIMKDSNSSPSGKIPVIYCHHSTGTAKSAFPPVAIGSSVTDKMLSVITERLTVLGHPVGLSDQAGPQSWGNDAAQSEVTALLNLLGSSTGCRTDRVLLLADSMGTLLALNWARANLAKVAALAILLPIPDLQYAHSDPGGNVLSTSIDSGYTNTAGYVAAEPTHNPSKFAASYKDQFIKMWYSSDDVVGAPSEVSDFLTEISAAGGAGSVASASMGANGHAIPSSFDINAVTNFLHAHG